MSKPLSLFVRPPYQAGGETWSLVYGYGPDPTAPATAPVFHSQALLRSTGACQVRAAVAGKLSTRPPEQVAGSPFVPSTPPDTDAPLPATIDLYIKVPDDVANDSAFQTRAATLGGILGFGYFNIDTGSIADALKQQLDLLIDPPGFFTREQTVRLLLSGLIEVKLEAGQVFGQGSTQGAPAGSRQVGFTVLTPAGPLDPAHSYDVMRDFVADGQPAVDQFTALVPKRWPVIDAALGTDAAIGLTANTLYSMPVLEQLRTSRSLTRAQWRQVGNNQKALFRDRLLRRVGRFTGTNPPAPFEFDDVDWQNVFQLEAVVELYTNFDDPWAAGATPRAPTDTNYQAVDFLDFEGATATVSATNPKVLTLDGAPALDDLWEGKDKITLNSDTARPSRIYTIVEVDAAAHTVKLDQAPTLTGGTSSWRIRKRPMVVLIDAFGGREGLSGTAAKVDGTQQDLLRLNGGETAALRKVNKNFDTVYLPSDTARPSRTYRILDVNATDKTLKLDGKPSFGDGASAWHVPAGLSGELTPFPNGYNLGPNNPPSSPHVRGNDHYDGMAFVVDEGRVQGRVRFTSYTSRTNAFTSQGSSSVRGNRGYYLSSYRSGKSFINYTFAVVDPDQYPSDVVQEARFYFPTQVTRDADGKGAIRIHLGNTTMPNGGTGSEGCIVSPLFYELRRQIIARYQAEYAALHPPNGSDAQVQKAANATTHAQSTALYGNTGPGGLLASNWNDKICAVLWLIRPDERPLG